MKIHSFRILMLNCAKSAKHRIPNTQSAHVLPWHIAEYTNHPIQITGEVSVYEDDLWAKFTLCFSMLSI